MRLARSSRRSRTSASEKTLIPYIGGENGESAVGGMNGTPKVYIFFTA